MASSLYNTGLAKLTGTATAIVWGTEDTRILLLKSGYTFDPDHDFVADLTPASFEITASGYARQALSGETKTTDDTNNRIVFDASDVSYSMSAGETVVAAVIYSETGGADASRQLIAYIDLADIATEALASIVWASTGIFYIGVA